MSPELQDMEYDSSQMQKEYFAKFYHNAEEMLSHWMPLHRGQSLFMTTFVAASHAANKEKRRMHVMGILPSKHEILGPKHVFWVK